MIGDLEMREDLVYNGRSGVGEREGEMSLVLEDSRKASTENG